MENEVKKPYIYFLSQSLDRSGFFPDNTIQLDDSNLFNIFKNIATFFCCLVRFNFSHIIFRQPFDLSVYILNCI